MRMGKGDEGTMTHTKVHTGRLIRKLAALFLAFAAVAVLLNCVLTYASTRTTYLKTESARLQQVGAYAEGAEDMAQLEAWGAAWQEHADEIDPSTTIEEADRMTEELLSRFSEEFATLVPDGTDETQARIEERHAAFEVEASILEHYTYSSMLDRLATYFEVADISLVVPNRETGEVVYLTERVKEGQTMGAGRPPAQVEARTPREDYAVLWATFESGEVQQGMDLSPDGARYTAYVPVAFEEADPWLFQVSIGTQALNDAVMAQMAGTVVVSCAIFAVCLALMLVLLRRSLVRPLVALDRHVKEYAAEKSPATADAIREERLPSDEVGALAGNVAGMIDELQRHMDDIERMSAERERVRSELAVASRIQLSVLPDARPPFSGCDDFGLAASMHPAKEVGGDFYDFFMVDERRCGVVVADVSGKGVPAAMFMMRSKTLLKQLIVDGLSPAEALVQANESLCADNEAGMFVTVWLGVLDVKTGALAYANGGHNPPLYRSAHGEVTWLRDRSGLLLGSFAGVPYRGFERTMKTGDALVLYTDGVTEAMDVNDKCFGDERLFDAVTEIGDELPGVIAARIEERVASFAAEAQQADDITLLVLRFFGGTGGVSMGALERS